MNKLPNLIFIGESMAGKSTIVHYLSSGKFKQHLGATIGAAMFTYTNPDYGISAQVWDTAGQEKFDSLMPLYIRNGDVFALTVDISIYSNFSKDPYDDNITREVVKRNLKKYVNTISKHLKRNFRVIIILNKCDTIKDPILYEDITADVNSIMREVLADLYMDMDEDRESFFKPNFDTFRVVMLSSVYGIGFSGFNGSIKVFLDDLGAKCSDTNINSVSNINPRDKDETSYCYC